MRINGKSIGITVGLLVVLGVVIIVEISLFITGPTRRYEHSIAQETKRIEESHKDIKNITRHVFHYTTYVGEEENRILWFNVKGKAIISKKKSTLKMEEVQRIAMDSYDAQDVKVSLGYGYKNPVYVIECDTGTILLDYDTLKEVHFLKEGDV